MKRVLPYSLMILLLFFCISNFEIDQAEKREVSRQHWREDFDYIVTQIEALHPNPYRVTSRSELEDEFNKLVPMTDTLSDDEVAFEIGRVIALLADGHTGLSSKYTVTETFYPLTCRIIEGKLYIVDGVDKYKDIFYSEIVSLNDKKASDLIDVFSPYMSADNKYMKESNVEWRLFNPRVLNYLDVIQDDMALELTLKKGDSISTREIKVMPYIELGKYYKERKSWVNSFGVYNYYYDYIPDLNIMVVNYNSCYEDDSLSFDTFSTKLWQEVIEKEVDKIVINLLYNTGGYESTIEPLFNRLLYSKYNEDGKLFVVIGKRTNSAASVTATWMRNDLNVEIIGEPTGGSPRMYYVRENCITPNNGIELYIATDTFYAGEYTVENAIVPDVEIIKTIEDYRSNINPYLQYVENY